MKRDLTQLQFGRLTVLRFQGSVKRDDTHYVRKWLCECSCGEQVSVPQDALIQGKSKSCGCLKSEISGGRLRTHGQTGSATYKIWCGMKKRCNQKNSPVYYKYGGRGIQVCDRWNSFENFLEDMGERPRGLTIERIDNNGNYEPGNCRWATPIEQGSNKRNTICAFPGESLRQTAIRLGVNYKSLWKLYRDQCVPLNECVRRLKPKPSSPEHQQE